MHLPIHSSTYLFNEDIFDDGYESDAVFESIHRHFKWIVKVNILSLANQLVIGVIGTAYFAYESQGCFFLDLALSSPMIKNA